MKTVLFHIFLLFTFASLVRPAHAYNLRDQIRRIEIAVDERRQLVLVLNRTNEKPVKFERQYLENFKKYPMEVVYLSHEETSRDQDTDPIYIRSTNLDVLRFLPDEAFTDILLGPCSEKEFEKPTHPQSPSQLEIFKKLKKLLKPGGLFHRGIGEFEKEAILRRLSKADRVLSNSSPKLQKKFLSQSVSDLRQQVINERLFEDVWSSFGGGDSLPFPFLDDDGKFIWDSIVFMKKL
ncbi:MAG: hypothetical protein HYX41_06220 [Bdellovibrio sp.]|nr:hypothetical protein [Bdellovibrio sp.]